jgi:hypothetical protein
MQITDRLREDGFAIDPCITLAEAEEAVWRAMAR